MPVLSSRHTVAASFVLAALALACTGGDARSGTTPSPDSGRSSGGTGSSGAGGTANASGGTGADATVGGAGNVGGVGGSTGGAPNAGSGGAIGAGTGGAVASGGADGAAGTSMGTGGATTEVTTRLVYLDVAGRVLSANVDGSDVRVLVRGASGLPDGVAVDVVAGHIFWTNMGVPNANDGFIDRVDLDGGTATVVVPAGRTFTPKQLKLDATNGKLYWADREGMRILRANLDGTQLETLVETGSGDAARRDAANWCVGIALDVPKRQIYWTQKGGDNAGVGSIRRAGMDLPAGDDPAHRSDIEILFDKLPEPIDLDLDLSTRLIYWTDRGNPPRGNTVSRAPMDPPAAGAAQRTDQKILVSGLAEGIGISLDLRHQVMYFTDLGGTVYVANLDGSAEKKLLTGQGSLTGIAYVELPR